MEKRRISQAAPSAEALYRLELVEAEARLWKAEYILARRRELDPPSSDSQHESDAHRVKERDKRLEELEAKRSIGQNALAGLTEPDNSVLSAVLNVMVR